MNTLQQRLQGCLEGRVCLVGIGNVDLGDDGFGVRLAESLGKSEIRSPKSERNPKFEIRRVGRVFGDSEVTGEAAECSITASPSPRPSPSGRGGFSALRYRDLTVIVAGTTPERQILRVCEEEFDQVIFLDAVEAGAAPGSLVLFEGCELTTRFPQVSTHKFSLGLLAQIVEGNGKTKAWLLGVQPESLASGRELSQPVQTTLDALVEILAQRFPPTFSGNPVSQLSTLNSQLPC